MGWPAQNSSLRAGFCTLYICHDPWSTVEPAGTTIHHPYWRYDLVCISRILHANVHRSPRTCKSVQLTADGIRVRTVRRLCHPALPWLPTRQRRGSVRWISVAQHKLPPRALLTELRTRPEVCMLTATLTLILTVSAPRRLHDPRPRTSHASPARAWSAMRARSVVGAVVELIWIGLLQPGEHVPVPKERELA